MQFEQIAIAVAETSQVGEARRAMASLSAGTTLEETDRGRAAIVTSELAANLVRHARGGMILMRALGSGDGVELIALDRGPGMTDVERCLRDGFSTGGTPGTGLGAVRRLSNEFDLHSAVPTGTIVVARVLDSRRAAIRRDARIPWAGVSVPVAGEEVSGDALCVVTGNSRVSLMVADGLGHGVVAAEAARPAAALFSKVGAAIGPAEFLLRAHEELRGTRGAALAAVQVDLAAGTLRHAAIGNISMTVIGGEGRHGLVSLNGTVGAQIRQPREFESSWPEHSLLIMHSDGISSRWNLESVALRHHHPAVIAGALYRDHSRGTDDATVLVARLVRPA